MALAQEDVIAGPDAVVMGGRLGRMAVAMIVIMAMRMSMGMPMRMQGVIVRHDGTLARYPRKIMGCFKRMNPGWGEWYLPLPAC